MATKTIEVKLYTSELIYDIQLGSDITAQSKRELSPEHIAAIKVGEDENNINHILRSIGNAFAEVKNQLADYLEVDKERTTNKLITREDNLILTINRLPSNYNEATAEAINSAVHQYIVNTALKDWFIATSPSDAGDYAKLAGENLKSLREAINKRNRPKRPTVV